jgi:hypothetical protein
MAKKDETEIGITGLPIPKRKMSAKNRYNFEKKRRENLGQNVGGVPYKSDVNPNYNPREEFDGWVEELWNEGYDLSDWTWEGLFEYYLDERKYDVDEKLPGSGKTPRQKMERQRGKHAANYLLRGRETKDRNDQQRTSHFNRASTMDTVKAAQDAGEEPSKDPKWKNTIAARRRPRASYEVPNERPGGLRAGNTKAGGHRTLVRKKETQTESIVEYLFVEGYADTIESAEIIANNIGDAWENAILDEAKIDNPTKDDLEAVKGMPLSHKERMSQNQKAIEDMRNMKNPNKLSGKAQLDAMNKK